MLRDIFYEKTKKNDPSIPKIQMPMLCKGLFSLTANDAIVAKVNSTSMIPSGEAPTERDILKKAPIYAFTRSFRSLSVKTILKIGIVLKLLRCDCLPH